MTTVPIITNYNNTAEKHSHYLWVFAEDLSENHPPVLDWQSGLENLEQLHTEPIKQKSVEQQSIVQKKEEPEGSFQICVISDGVSSGDTEELEKMVEMLKKMQLTDISEHLEGFLQTNDVEELLEAVRVSEARDPVSHYRLKKFAQNCFQTKE